MTDPHLVTYIAHFRLQTLFSISNSIYIFINYTKITKKIYIGEMAKGQWRPERAIPFEPKFNKNIKINIIP